jgi:hypothetical protein
MRRIHAPDIKPRPRQVKQAAIPGSARQHRGWTAPALSPHIARRLVFREHPDATKKSKKEGLPKRPALSSLPSYFADAVLTAGGNNSWLRAATQ